MPVQLAISVRLQMHVYTCHVCGNGKHGLVLLSRSARAFQTQSVMREAHRPLGVWRVARVCSWGGEEITVD
jgi:hypothetical protein